MKPKLKFPADVSETEVKNTHPLISQPAFKDDSIDVVLSYVYKNKMP